MEMSLDASSLEQQLSNALKFLEASEASTTLARGFADGWVEFLDEAIEGVINYNSSLAVRGIQRLQLLSHHVGCLPQSCYFSEKVPPDSLEWISSSGMSDVYRISVEGKQAALKVIRMNVGYRDKMKKVVYHEAIMWRYLRHPHIVPFLGVAGSHDATFSLVSEWMPHGTISSFLKNRLTENRLTYIADIICGLSYLHMLGIVHGDLKSANILVDDRFKARICDFGLTTVFSGMNTMSGTSGTVRWMAPELLCYEEPQKPTMQSDVYAFGIVCWELFTGEIPFAHIKCDPAVVLAVHKGVRPAKPELLPGTLGFCEEVWKIITSCWSHDLLARPNVVRLTRLIGRLRGEDPDVVLIDVLKRLGRSEAEFVENPCRELVMMAASKDGNCTQEKIIAATAGLGHELQRYFGTSSRANRQDTWTNLAQSILGTTPLKDTDASWTMRELSSTDDELSSFYDATAGDNILASCAIRSKKRDLRPQRRSRREMAAAAARRFQVISRHGSERSSLRRL